MGLNISFPLQFVLFGYENRASLAVGRKRGSYILPEVLPSTVRCVTHRELIVA